ncbi:vWA domain-containing protein [Solidesulfovibrio sp.]
MTVARPEMLWLLAAVAVCLLLAGLAAKRRRAIAAAYPTLAAAPGRRRIKSLCFLAGLTALALAAAGPRFGAGDRPPPPVEPARLRLVIALDCSRSMLARDLAPDRLGAAKALLLDVLARLPRVEVGLVGFAGRAWLACPLTSDRAGLALFLDALSPEAAPLGGTDPATALEAARLALEAGGSRPGAVLLVSDGEATTAAGDAAPRAGGTPIFTVAVGAALPAPLPDASGAGVLVGVDAPALTELARESGGAAFRLAPDAANPAEALAAALRARAGQEPPETADDGPGDGHGRLLLALGLALLLADLCLAPAGRSAALLAAALLLAAVPAPAASSAADKTAQGLAASARREHQAALDAFLAARARDPDAPAILFDIGTAYYRLGRFQAARDAFDRAARTAAPALAAKARYNQGNAAYRLGDVPGAVAGYEAALALTPDDADARANLDWLRAHPTPPPPPAGQTPDPKQPGQSPDGQSSPDAGPDPSGQAPASQGTDDGSGTDGDADQPPRPGPARDPATALEAQVPVAAPEGEKGGPRRAGSPGAADDPVLGRIPDLPGLPATPVYSRPTVEKDW